MVLALAVARVLVGVVNLVKGRLATRVGVALTFDLRAKLVQKLHALGVGYYDRHQVGSLVSRVAYDSEVLHSLLQQITGGFLLQIVQVMAVGVMLFTLNPKLALYTLIPAPLVVVGSWYLLEARASASTTATGTPAASRPARCRACSRAFAWSRRLPRRTASTSGSTASATTCGIAV